MTEPYEPKHLYRRGRFGKSHCCFSGCRPMDEHGCCANMGWHEPHCPLNPALIWEASDHEFYVEMGLRKHLASETTVYEDCRTLWQIPYPAPVASIEVEG